MTSADTAVPSSARTAEKHHKPSISPARNMSRDPMQVEPWGWVVAIGWHGCGSGIRSEETQDYLPALSFALQATGGCRIATEKYQPSVGMKVILPSYFSSDHRAICSVTVFCDPLDMPPIHRTPSRHESPKASQRHAPSPRKRLRTYRQLFSTNLARLSSLLRACITAKQRARGSRYDTIAASRTDSSTRSRSHHELGPELPTIEQLALGTELDALFRQ